MIVIKIYIGNLFVIPLAKLTHKPSLSDLTCSFEYKRFALRGIFPFYQFVH